MAANPAGGAGSRGDECPTHLSSRRDGVRRSGSRWVELCSALPPRMLRRPHRECFDYCTSVTRGHRVDSPRGDVASRLRPDLATRHSCSSRQRRRCQRPPSPGVGGRHRAQRAECARSGPSDRRRRVTQFLTYARGRRASTYQQCRGAHGHLSPRTEDLSPSRRPGPSAIRRPLRGRPRRTRGRSSGRRCRRHRTLEQSVDVIEGHCVSWYEDEGWGVLASDLGPGPVWAHLSNVEVAGYRSLSAGERVAFEWEPAPGGDQDGYAYRATRVIPATQL